MGKREAFGFGLRLANFCKAEKKRAVTEDGEVGGREEVVSPARTWEKEIKMFQMDERERGREKEKRDQSGFTTLADGAILLHGAFYVSEKLLSFLLLLLLHPPFLPSLLIMFRSSSPSSLMYNIILSYAALVCSGLFSGICEFLNSRV